MKRNAYAYKFKTDLSLPEVFNRLNELGPWRWLERDNDRWGEYLSARAIEAPHDGLAKILIDEGQFVINVALKSEASDPQPAFDAVRKLVLEQILPAIRRAGGNAPLVLDGEELSLISVTLDERPARFEATPEKLSVYDVPDRFTLETVSRIVPHKNTKLEGLYATKTGFVTQCEAEGFRRITWFLDRPDVMARYTTTIHADAKRYPVLLSNGNLLENCNQTLIDTSPMVIFRHVWADRGRSYISPNVSRIMGYSPEEIIVDPSENRYLERAK